jgi:isoquinoline 1-oxidoreductase beta subunit
MTRLADAPQVARTDFLRIIAISGAGLTLGVARPSAARAETGHEFSPVAWLKMHADGTATVMVNDAELGQGIATTFAMLVAEELDQPLDRMRFELAPAEPRYYDPNQHAMSTGGSRSTKSMGPTMRQAGATARAMLVAAAAQKWNVDAKDCVTANGLVTGPARQRATYAELLDLAATLPVPAKVALKTPDRFRLIGTRARRLDVPQKTNGRAVYGLDVKVAGMRYASVEKPREIGGSVASFDASAALKVPGVRQVVQITSGVAVIADNTWAAFQGRKALVVHYAPGVNANLSTQSLYANARGLVQTRGAVLRNTGDAGASLAAGTVIGASYETPYLAHATMEPMNATADVRADRATLWLSTQSPTNTQKEAARITGLPLSAITVNPTLCGGGFGRRSEIDFVADAVEVSKAIGGPVKVVWTREDDIRNDPYRPGTAHALAGTLNSDGTIAAYRHTLACASINARTSPDRVKNGADPGVLAGSGNLPYAIPNVLVDYHMLDGSIPVGHWRAPYANANTFATESFVDELAHAARKDALAFRLAMLPAGRPRTVLELASQKAGWNAPLPKGRARGLAMGQWDDAWIAVIAEVSMPDERSIKIHRMTGVIDVGMPVNVDGLETQVTSAMIYGISGALYGRIDFDHGAPVQGNFNDYPVLKMADAPMFDVGIVRSLEPSLGAGEIGTPCVAPALANAVFALCGKRVRKLPLLENLA